MKSMLTIFFLASLQFSVAQVAVSGARSLGMGRSDLTGIEVNSLFANQAGLSKMDNIGIIVAAERRFLLAEFNLVAAGVAVPTRSGTIGITIQNYGFQEFRQQKLGLAYARKLLDNFSIGAQFDFFQTRIPEYGSSGRITFEAGTLVGLTKKIALGAHVFSPARVKLSDEDVIPTVFNLGLSYQPSELARVALAFEKDIDFPLRIKAGMEYRMREAISIRAGFGTNPATLHLGLGFRLNDSFNFDTAGSYHQTLGLTPSASASYYSPRKK